MEQLKKLIASLSLKQRISIVAAALLAGAALYGLSNWQNERDFKPLYSSLAPEDASAILAKLKEGSVLYRLADSGTTILVPSEKVAELRLEMAGAGIPKSGRIGFELFDKPNFGATNFAEQVNFRRALEGELERSIKSISEVEQARVHLTFPKESVFLESRMPAKASVMLRLRPGVRLQPQNVNAIAHLVSSAVEGLAPEAVSVLDMRGNLLSRPRRSGEEAATADALEYKEKIEKDLIAKVSATLDPLLGSEKFRTGVSVECDFSSGEQSEEIYDPEKSVMLTSQKSEDSAGGALSAGVPGAASNLPRPTSRPGGGAGSGTSRKTESITYQSSKTVRRLRLPQGSVKRMSVSVLLDHDAKWEGQGAKKKLVISPLSPEKLKSVRELVAGVTGLQPTRGDLLVIESLPFESTLNQQAPTDSLPPATAPALPVPEWMQPLMKNPILLIGAGAGLFLLICAMLFFLMKKSKKKASKTKIEISTALAANEADADGNKVVSSGNTVEEMQNQLKENAEKKQQLLDEARMKLNLPSVTSKKLEVLTAHLRDTAGKESALAASVVRTWLQEPTR